MKKNGVQWRKYERGLQRKMRRGRTRGERGKSLV